MCMARPNAASTTHSGPCCPANRSEARTSPSAVRCPTRGCTSSTPTAPWPRAAFAVPSAFMVLDRFPLNASGKVDRARMPRVENAQEMAQGAAYVEPRGTHEQVLATAWAAVLGRETIGAGDHFFSLGGDSIKALQVI